MRCGHRQLVKDNLARNFPEAAVFFANKLTTLSDSPVDLLLLAQVRMRERACVRACVCVCVCV